MPAWRSRVSAAIAALTLVGGAVVYSTGAAAPAGAAGLLPTTTTVTASPASSAANPVPFGHPVTLTADVSLFLVGGLLILPSGPVSFSFVNNGITVPLGSATLSSCLLHLNECTASITTQLPPGTQTVTASYAGQLLAGGSNGTTQVTTAPEPAPGGGTTQTGCAFASSCTFDNPNIGEEISFSAPNDGSVYSIDASYVPEGLPCDDLSLNVDDVQFQLVGPPPSEKLVRLSFINSAADTLNNEFGNIPPAPPNGTSPICYQSDTDFLTASGLPASYSPTSQSFTGLLPVCTTGNSGTVAGDPAPCIEQAFAGDGFYEIDMALPGGDPRVGP